MSAEKHPDRPWQNVLLVRDGMGYEASRSPQPISSDTPEPEAPSATSQLYPELPADTPDYVRANFEHFYHRPNDRQKGLLFIRLGITPTNNLHRYFDETQGEFLPDAPTVPNWQHRNSHPFGHIIDRLRVEQPDLWARALKSERDYKTAYSEHKEARSSNEHTDHIPLVTAKALEAATWHNRAVMSEVFSIIAPQMQAEGIDPVTACV